jgi:hypothetical protein
MIRTAFCSALFAASLLAALAAPVAADSSFAGVVRDCPLIVLARVAVRSDGAVTLRVEQVLKGHAAAHLPFPPSTPAVQPGWTRAVVAFTDTSTIARGVTFAWHVSASGAVDPERLDQFPGIPQTLDAMLAWFHGLPATDALATAGDTPKQDPRLAVVAAVAVVAFAGAVYGRRHDNDRVRRHVPGACGVEPV